MVSVENLGIVKGQTPDGRDIEMHLYTGELQGTPHPEAEIVEATWMSKVEIGKNKTLMTPMTLEHVLPFLASAKIW